MANVSHRAVEGCVESTVIWCGRRVSTTLHRVIQSLHWSSFITEPVLRNTTAYPSGPLPLCPPSYRIFWLGWVGTPGDFTFKRFFKKKIHLLGEVTSATSKNFKSCPLESLPSPDNTCWDGTKVVEWPEKVPSKPLASLVGIDNEFTGPLWLSPWELRKSRHFICLIVS